MYVGVYVKAMTIGGISSIRRPIVLVFENRSYIDGPNIHVIFVGTRDIYIKEDQWIRRRWTEEAMLSCDDAHILH